MKAVISLDLHSPEEAERVLQAINPDNAPLPQGLEIDCVVRESQLLISIHCKRGLNSLSSTIEDILSAIDLSIRTSKSLDANE